MNNTKWTEIFKAFYYGAELADCVMVYGHRMDADYI